MQKTNFATALVNQPHFEYNQNDMTWICYMPVIPKTTTDPIVAKAYSWQPDGATMEVDTYKSRFAGYWNFADHGLWRIDEPSTSEVLTQLGKEMDLHGSSWSPFGDSAEFQVTYADHGFVWHLDPFWQQFFAEIRACGEVSDEFYEELSLATWWGSDYIKDLVHGERSVLAADDLKMASKTLDEIDKNNISEIDAFWQRLVVSLAYNAITNSDFFEQLAVYSKRKLSDIQRMLDLAAGAVLQHPNFQLTGFQHISPK
jgi:hypothetical protein